MLSKNAKLTNLKEFELGEYSIKCWTYETRYSWGHYAKLYKNGDCIDDTKITYYNRTWESYEYESIIHSLLGKNGLDDLKALADSIGGGNVQKELKNLKGLVTLAGIIGTSDTQFKVLEGVGIDKPEGWDNLSEDEKQKRIGVCLEALE